MVRSLLHCFARSRPPRQVRCPDFCSGKRSPRRSQSHTSLVHAEDQVLDAVFFFPRRFFYRSTQVTLRRNKLEHPEITSKLPTTGHSKSSFCSSNLHSVSKSFRSSTESVEHHKNTSILIALYTACDCRVSPNPYANTGQTSRKRFPRGPAPQTVCEVHDRRNKAKQRVRHPKVIHPHKT